MMKFIVMFQILINIQSYIIFDQGYNEQFNYDAGFRCNNVDTIKTTVSFSGNDQFTYLIILLKFRPKYQLFLRLSLNDIILQVLLKLIQSLSQLNFQLEISCYLNQIWRYYFTWYESIQYSQLYAINDNRIRILQQPIENNCVDQIQLYLYSFTQFTKSNTSYGYSPGLGNAYILFEFLFRKLKLIKMVIQPYEITSSTVKIILHNSNSNLLQVGYQIVLGTSEAFQKSELIETFGGQHTLFTKSIKQLNYGTLALPPAGFYWDVGDNIRLNITSQQILDETQYSISTFASTYMNSIRFFELWLFEQILFPMYIYSYRVTKKYERFIPHPIKVSIIELNSEYYNIGEFQAQVPNTMTTLIIQIELKFYQGEKVVGTFLKCNECGSKNVYKIEQNYLGGINFIKYRLLLRQYSINVQNLKISIGLQSVTIKQIINQVVEDYQIVQLQFVWVIKINEKKINNYYILSISLNG